MNSLEHNNTALPACSLRSAVMRKHRSGKGTPISLHRRRMPLTVSMLFVLVMHPWLAMGAEDTIGKNPPDSSASQIITPKQELMMKMEGMKSVRIVMHANEPSQRLADQLQELLTALGAKGVEMRIVDDVPNSNQVRYYHAADKEAGQVVGEALSLVFDEVAVRNFEDYQPSPSDGLIEIWLR